MDSFCQRYHQTVELQNKLDAPMPWIGVYIAAASVACLLAMILDAFRGFRLRKIWLPCKYFSLNAFSLTLLAITVKLPLDLTSNTLGHNDKIARLSSLVLISTCMANFMASLGSMENSEVILNLAALAILAITVAVNVFIHNFQMSSFEQTHVDVEILPTVLMLLLLVNMCCMAIMVLSAKRYIESKYNEMHKRFSNEGVYELGVVVRRYWVMAATSSPQFVMARSAISATSGVMCLAMATVLALLLGELHLNHMYHGLTVKALCVSSTYGWSINWILHIQSVGVVFGSIAPLLRWYVASWFKFLEIRRKGLKEQVKIEKYWTSKLVEWRESSLSIQFQHNKSRKLLHGAKRLVLNICIGFQYLVVLINKTVIFVCACIGVPIHWCFCGTSETGGSESTAATRDLRPFVVLLEGETQLPERILRNICNEVDTFIQIGENKQLNNLIQLLSISVNFDGVKKFDSNEVDSLHSPEPPNCWSLPVVTLTSIALALPNVTNDRTRQLLSGVSEGLNLVNLMEKTHDKNGQVENIRDAADMVWVGVELYRKWLHNDLQDTTLRGKSHKETLNNLSSIAQEIIKDFIGETEDILKQNPLVWPAKVIAAYSMYRVTQTFLLDNCVVQQMNADLFFDRLCVIISDILAAGLTNLEHMIRLKCYKSGVKEREQSVKEAATLLGVSRQIRPSLEQHGHVPIMNEKNDAVNIDNWRPAQNSEDVLPFFSASTSFTTSN